MVSIGRWRRRRPRKKLTRRRRVRGKEGPYQAADGAEDAHWSVCKDEERDRTNEVKQWKLGNGNQ
jgi:hypothetical protein